MLGVIGRMFEALLAVSRGDVVGGSRLLRAGFDEWGALLPLAKTAGARSPTPRFSHAMDVLPACELFLNGSR